MISASTMYQDHVLQLEGEINSKRKLMTVKDAIGDLPRIEPGNGKDHWFDPYQNKGNLTKYQKKMRKQNQRYLSSFCSMKMNL